MILLEESTLNDIIKELHSRFSSLVIGGICAYDFHDDCSEGEAYFYVVGSETQRRGLISMLDDYNLDNECADLIDIEDDDEDYLAFGL